jgi:glycoprotein endo-alpha-1,2-mannosidase
MCYNAARSARMTRLTLRFRSLLISTIVFTLVMGGSSLPRSPLVGAYYYGWYNHEHWQLVGHVGRHLPEPLEPSHGEYDSEDPAVVAAHVKWAEQFAIDFFIVSWSGRDTMADRQAREKLLPALAKSRVRQAPLIELLSYGERNLLNPALRDPLMSDVRYLGEHYLKHPSAMRIGARPVLFLYVSRVLRGDVPGWIRDVRAELGKAGIDPFIVADEVFWDEPQPERIAAYDAITAYNVYDWPRREQQAGWAAESGFFSDVEALFARWQAAAREAGVAFVPNVMPGYNDRGVRLDEDHFVIPRQLRPDGSPTGFLERSIDLAQHYTDPQLRMVTVTSFNEWHEWTQLEPARRTTAPARESDPSLYTMGFPHPAYSFEYLKVIRDRFSTSAERAAVPAP